MGLFNVLNATVQCPHCGREYEARVQFNFGATRQLEYRLGDILAWGYNEIGVPRLPRVKAYGMIENSEYPKCGVTLETYKENEFDVFIENDVPISVVPMAVYEDYLVNPKTKGDYKVL